MGTNQCGNSGKPLNFKGMNELNRKNDLVTKIMSTAHNLCRSVQADVHAMEGYALEERNITVDYLLNKKAIQEMISDALEIETVKIHQFLSLMLQRDPTEKEISLTRACLSNDIMLVDNFFGVENVRYRRPVREVKLNIWLESAILIDTLRQIES